LRNKIAEKFQEVGIPINLMHASSMVIGNKMKITKYLFDALEGYLSLGMVPLIGGDMMFDNGMGFSVCSGDQLTVEISRKIKAKRLIFATDVAGIFDSDPKINNQASLIKEMHINELESMIKILDESETSDASGRMKGKLITLTSIKDIITEGLETVILSMMEKGVLKGFLESRDVSLTKIISK
jgi:isopentenyl phosphate kinase